MIALRANENHKSKEHFHSRNVIIIHQKQLKAIPKTKNICQRFAKQFSLVASGSNEHLNWIFYPESGCMRSFISILLSLWARNRAPFYFLQFFFFQRKIKERSNRMAYCVVCHPHRNILLMFFLSNEISLWIQFRTQSQSHRIGSILSETLWWKKSVFVTSS